MSNNKYVIPGDPMTDPFWKLHRHQMRSTTDVVAEQVVIAGISYASASILMWMFAPMFNAIGAMITYPFRRLRQKRKSDSYKRFLSEGHTNWRDVA